MAIILFNDTVVDNVFFLELLSLQVNLNYVIAITIGP